MDTNTTPVVSRPYRLAPLPDNAYYVEPVTAEQAGRGAIAYVEQSDPFDFYTFRASKVVYQGRTQFQNVAIIDTYNFGRALMLDGAIQSSADDEELYHEMLVQPAMLAHANPQSVLIIGGGEGATLREVLVHRSVQNVTMVDLDRELVELCREHLGKWHRGAFDDPRVRLVFDDGRHFVAEDTQTYDVVIIDVVDMLDNGPAQALYTRQFYELLAKRLRPGAIVAVQGLEFSCLDDKPHTALARTLRTVFAEVYSYATVIPSFLGNWGYLIASNFWRPQDMTAETIDRTIEQRLGLSWLSHLTGDFLKSSFVFSKETQFLLSQPGPIIEDGVDFIAPPDIAEYIPTTMQFPLQPGS